MQITGNAFNTGLSGIQSGMRRVDQAASEIASSTLPAQVEAQPVEAAVQAPNDLAGSLVGLTQGRYEVQANARVVETADEVLGTLIDTRA